MFWRKGKEDAPKVKKVKPKEIPGGAWGHLVSAHHIDVDTLSKWRCVDLPGEANGQPVMLLRIFNPKTVQEKGVVIEGWATFDEHPELILFEGYLDRRNNASLEKKNHS